MTSSSPSPSGVLAFLHICTNLKTTKRTGWVERGISGPESIADHMHRMGIMALLLEDPGIDKSRAVKIAIVHDLAESLVGDLTPHCGVSKEEKHARELAAMETIQNLLGGKEAHVAAEIMELWEEYERAQTPEARVVKDLDKFEMICQAFEYEKAQGFVLDDFFASTKGKIKHPLVLSWVEELHNKRAEFFKLKSEKKEEK